MQTEWVSLDERQRDALREVANIGAGHAATALSQMTDRVIMISVPEVQIRRLEDVAELLGPPDTPVAAVAMHVMGDLTGQSMVILPSEAARVLCDLLLRRPAGTTKEFGEMEQHLPHLQATDSSPEHVERAVQLSFDRYCSVAGSIAPDMRVSWEVEITPPSGGE